MFGLVVPIRSPRTSKIIIIRSWRHVDCHRSICSDEVLHPTHQACSCLLVAEKDIIPYFLPVSDSAHLLYQCAGVVSEEIVCNVESKAELGVAFH